jgi:hypothetical protein
MKVTEIGMTNGELALKNADTLYGPNHPETKFWQWCCHFGNRDGGAELMRAQAKKHSIYVPENTGTGNFFERFREKFMQVYAEKGEKVFE